MPISALQVAGISSSESRSCDYISPPCIYAFRTLYFYFLHGKLNRYDDDDVNDLAIMNYLRYGMKFIIFYVNNRLDT